MEAFYRKATGKLTAASPGDSEVVQSDVSALKEERARLEAAVENITDGEAAPDASALRKACENIIVLANQS